MSIDSIAPTTPITVSNTYDKYWILNVSIDGSKGPLAIVNGMAKIIPMNSQTGQLAPLEMAQTVSVYDIMQRIKNGEKDVAASMGWILAVVQRIGKAQGAIA